MSLSVKRRFLAVIQQAVFAGMRRNRFSVREGLRFWTDLPVVGNYTYSELTPFRRLLLTGFKGGAELGFIDGGGILLAFLATSFRFPTRRWVYSLCWSLVAAGLSYDLCRQLLVLLA
jgi:hypothetical protein